MLWITNDLHDPEAGDSENDLQHPQQRTDASEPCVCPAAANIYGARGYHHDIAYRADSADAAK